MATSITGLTLKGIMIKGSEFLTPNDISLCRAWWQWKTGITTVSGNVSAWADQSGSGHTLSQGTGTRRPAYNSSTGLVTPDGTDDYLRSSTSVNEANAEFTMVVQRPATPVTAVVIALDTNNTVDADTLNIIIANVVSRTRASGSPQSLISGAPQLISGEKYVVSVTTNQIFINGVEPSYSAQTLGQFSGAFRTRINMFANTRNSGGVETTPTSFGNTPCFEACWHGKKLTTLERTKLVSYFRIKHGI